MFNNQLKQGLAKGFGLRLIASTAALLALLAAAPAVRAFTPIETGNVELIKTNIEAGFSPGSTGEQLVIKLLDRAAVSVRLMGYSFTSAPVVQALLRARKRNVNVAVLVDHKNNLVQDRSGKARAALGALSTAGIAVRTISAYPIHHDKAIVVDGRHVQTGSFNYSMAAARVNSENVVVIWNAPGLADSFLGHWEKNWALGVAYQAPY